MAFSQYKEVVDILKKTKRPLMVLLKDVDADALGSSMAIVRAVRQNGARPILFCTEEIPLGLNFLLDPSVPVEHEIKNVPLEQIDTAVMVDSGHIIRSGIVFELEELKKKAPLLNIDHHRIHEPFGTVNLVDPDASSTTTLVYDILKLGGWKIDATIATAILAGVIADTDNFSNAATTIRSLEVAAHCYAKGAENRRIIRELYHSKPVEALRVWGEILTRLKKNTKWGIISTVIFEEDYKKHNLTDDVTEGLANFLNNLSDMRAALILKEMPNGEIKGSFRTTRNDVNVGALAAALGGGGHRKAAGFTIKGRIVRTPNSWKIE